MERERVTIVTDFDGVLADSDDARILFAQKEYGIYDLSPPVKRRVVVEQQGLMSVEQYRRLQQEVGGTWRYGRLMAPIPRVLYFVPKLYREGFPLSVVTSRTDEVIDGKEYKMLSVAKRWLKEWNLLQYFEEIKGAGYRQSKVPILKRLCSRPAVCIDDNVDKLLPMLEVVEYVFLLSRPHNLREEVPFGIRRVESWQEFYEAVCETKSEYEQLPLAVAG